MQNLVLSFKYLTKITARQNEVALSYHRVRELYFRAVIFATTITILTLKVSYEQHLLEGHLALILIWDRNVHCLYPDLVNTER